jgi:hypothetical protein
LEIGSFKIIIELSEYGYRLSLLMKCFSLRLAYFFIVNLFFNAMMQNSRPIEASEGGEVQTALWYVQLVEQMLETPSKVLVETAVQIFLPRNRGLVKTRGQILPGVQ